MNAKPLIPLPAVVADLGGTNARFAVIDANGALSEPVVFPIEAYADIAEALSDRVLPSLGVRPRSMLFAIAANIEGEQTKLTHGHWILAPSALLTAFDLEDVILLNDFEALALALPSLGSSTLRPIGERKAIARGPKVVLGPGTSLGVGALVPVGDAWMPLPMEGGHADFGPGHPRDFAVWQHLPLRFGRIKAETVLAGAGIENLYVAVEASIGGDRRLSGVSEIVAAAADGTDRSAREAISLFSRHLGRFAGDMALNFLARGGVYVGGGVVGRLGALFDEDAFLSAFRDKAPFNTMMNVLPTELIVHPMPALLGIAGFVAAPDRYVVDLSGRHWRKH